MLNYSVSERYNLYYWREGNFEVDFVIEKGDKVIGLEVKSEMRTENEGMAVFSENNSQRGVDFRRTFICNALSLGIPANVVMKWTGHSDYKAMKPYIDIADDIKANAMSKFNLL